MNLLIHNCLKLENMERFLDIIVPEYDCKEEFMKNLLHSISRQKNVDFNEIGIIIVNDKSKNKLRKGLFKNYPRLNIEYYLKDVNEGVGMTRQYGLDRSNAKYVTFVDQDDELYGNNSLSSMINYLKTTGLQYVTTNFVEEVKNDGKIVELLCSPLEGRQTLHGVFIDRHFLSENGIKFIPGFKVHDDYYLRIVMGLFENPVVVNITTYLWKYNENSQVRSKKKYAYMVETFDEYFRVLAATNDFRVKKNAMNSFSLVDNIISLFIILESNLFDYDDLREKKEKYEEELFKFICKYNKEIELSRDDIDGLYKGQYELQVKSYPDLVVFNNDLFKFIDEMSIKYTEYSYKRIEIEKVLDIIVPYYNPSQEMIDRLVNSIIGQKNFSFREICLTLVSDKSEVDIDVSSYKTKFPYLDINVYKKEQNEGQGLARQYGLDRSKAKYVTFVDQDDLLYGPIALSYVFKEMYDGTNDIIFTDFFRYDPDTNGKMLYSPSQMMCLHGVFFKRQSLIDGNYRFNDRIRLYEDTYFMQITNNTLKSCYINIPTYIWVVNNQSQTFIGNRGSQLIQKNPDDYIYANIDSIDFIYSKGKLSLDFYLYKLYEIFTVFESELFENYDVSKYEKIIYDLYNKYKDLYDSCSTEQKESTYKMAINSLSELYSATKINKEFKQFLNEMKKIKG